jgi:hypothetical protein
VYKRLSAFFVPFLVLTLGAAPVWAQAEDPEVEEGPETPAEGPSVDPIPEYDYDEVDPAEPDRKRVWLDQQAGLFGLGFSLGNPAGLTGKVWITPAHAMQFNVGGGSTGNHLRASLDYLYHWRMVDVPDFGDDGADFSLPFYVGLGASAGFIFDDPTLRGAQDSQGNYVDRDRVDLGIRIPIGMSVIIADLPVELSIEVAPDIILYEDFVAYIDGGFAVRYYF